MKSIVSVVSIIALGFGLLSCSSSGGGGGGDSTPAFAITTTAAPFGVVDNSYSTTLATVNGTAPFTWSLFTGSLPAGLNPINPSTGAITGTPTAPGNLTATFNVEDSTGKNATGTVSFAIHPRTDRVSVDSNGNSVAGATNTEPSISRTGGRFIAFTSTGSTLIAGVVGQQIYVHDRQTGQPSLASKSSLGSAGIGGVSSGASISADGRFIAFASTATNLVPGASGQQIYLHDTQTSVAFPNGQTTLVSKDNSGAPSDGSIKTNPAISADGRFITYEANATTLVPGVSGQQIYLHDTQTSVAFPNGQTTLVSKDNSGAPSDGSIKTNPAISADGRFITYEANATTLVPGASGQQIYLHDTQTSVAFPNGQTTLISKNNSGTAGDGLSKTPTISNDGRFIAFASASSNMVIGISGAQIYRHDTQASVAFPNGQTIPVSINDSGVAGVGLSTGPAITSDGSAIAFVSTAPLAPGAAAASDIYVRALP